MAWWRRIALAVLDNQAGFAAVVVVLGCVILFLPAYLFGKWAFIAVCAFLLGCAAGYDYARREWRRKGFVPKL